MAQGLRTSYRLITPDNRLLGGGHFGHARILPQGSVTGVNKGGRESLNRVSVEQTTPVPLNV
jgi:hypothetical protein